MKLVTYVDVNNDAPFVTFGGKDFANGTTHEMEDHVAAIVAENPWFEVKEPKASKKASDDK